MDQLNHPVFVVHSEKSAYLSNLICQQLVKSGISVQPLNVVRSTFPDGERYYRVDLSSNFEVLGKTAIYVCSLTSDEELLEIVRVGSTLVQLGIRRRIFILPFLAYSTMERAVKFGEVVTGKITIQMLSSIGGGGNGNMFLLFDLHTSGLLHYFEGSCIRLELYGQNELLSALPFFGMKEGEWMFASADLGRTEWVNAFAREHSTHVAFLRKTRKMIDGQTTTEVCEVIGNVQGYRLVIYDDMTRTGGTLMKAAEKYLESGALSVDVMLSHFAPVNDKVIHTIYDSKIRKVVITNSHPKSQHQFIKDHPEKFLVVDTSPIFVRCLIGILPHDLKVKN